MTNGRFKQLNVYPHDSSARATNVMSTQSAFCFEWSVKCFGNRFSVGIASELKPEAAAYISDYDQNSILFDVGSYPNGPGSAVIKMGSETIHSNLTEYKIKDYLCITCTIRFRFDPHAKKLLIDSVRILKFTARIYAKYTSKFDDQITNNLRMTTLK